MTKSELRIKYKSLRKEISNKKDKSITICKKVIKLDEFKNANVIALYFPLDDEVDLSFLFNSFDIKNKIMCFPRVHDDSSMDFYIVNSFDELQEGSFSIKEPVDVCKKVSPDDIDLIIVPLLIYDNKFNRIGYGKGYYDRYFKRGGSYKKIGVAYKEQFYLDLNPFISDDDVNLDGVLTD